MNCDKYGIRDAYHKEIEKKKNSVTADELRAAGYSEEDIKNAVFA